MRLCSFRLMFLPILALSGLCLTARGELVDSSDVMATCTSSSTEVDTRDEHDAYAALGGDGVEVVGDVDYTGDVTWTAGKTWIVTGVVLVKGGTLTIEPGTKVLLGVGSGIRQAGGTVVASGVAFEQLSEEQVLAFATAPGTEVDTREEHEAYAALGGEGVEVVGDVDYTGDVTWTAGKTWIVTGVVLVKGGTLTIEPGAEVLLGVGSGIRQVGGTVIAAGVSFEQLSEEQVLAFATAPGTDVDTREEHDAYAALGGEGVEVVGDLDITGDLTWRADKTWIVTGVVLVKGGTLTIEPGAKVLLGVGSGIRQVGGSVIATGAEFAQLSEEQVLAFATAPGTDVDTREEHDAYAALGGEGVEVVGDLDITGDVTWTADKTWIVTGVVLVKDGTLTIEHGAKVLLGVGSGIRQVGGTVVADGVAFSNLGFDGRMDYAEAEKGDVRLDTDVGVLRVAAKEESLTFSSLWGESEAAQVKVSYATAYGEKADVVNEAGPAEGEYLWQANAPGYYTFTHVAGDETLSATFVVMDSETTETVFEVDITESTDWAKDKVILIDGIVTVKSGATLTIEPGAVVKFMDGAGIVCEAGGRCVADGVIFTHVNDDTVGGDTLFDGSTSPLADMYVLSGVSGNDATQYRYHPDPTVTLSGTIARNEVWRGFNVYHVTGNITVQNGVTLTIEPGAVIKFDDGLSLVVDSGATLNAIGARAEPIVFTSIKDDDYGGDTNKDGDKTLPYPADWGCVLISGGTIQAEYCRFTYGSGVDGNQYGARACVFMWNGGSGTFDGCLFGGSLMDGCFAQNATFRNCIFMDCDRGLVSHSGAITAINCVATYNRIGFFSHTSPLIVRNSISSLNLESAITGDGGSRETSNCYFEDDPKFLDAEHGDFRIAEGSPCIDAADAAYAPETDYFGQPRVNAPDIGICEVIPRGTTSDIDLVPQSVTADAEAVSGQMLTVNWEVANNGGADVDDSWRDTISLVSANGREVVLGEKVSKKRLVAGGTISCSAVFTVPAIAEGVWYPKVNVNSSRDIFEGALGDNNALTGETAVNVSVNSLDLSVANEGVINAGTPTVLKLTFEATNENRMVSFDVPAGVTATWGFGFMPNRMGGSPVQNGNASGTVTASGSAPVQFLVPDNATEVYVILESDATSTYALATESTKMTIASVSPSTLPSSGTTTLTITGAGFSATNAVCFVNGGTVISPDSMQYVNSQCLIVSLDGSKLNVGQSYGLEVDGTYNTVQYDNAILAVGEEGQGEFWAEMVLPERVRAGRLTACKIKYGNKGNADIPVQVLQVTLGPENQGCLTYINSTNKVKSLQFVATGDREHAGVIRAGAEHSIDFIYIPEGKSSNRRETVLLHSSWGQSIVPNGWRSAEEYLSSMSAAAGRLGLRGGQTTSYAAVQELARKMSVGNPAAEICGRVVDGHGVALANVRVICLNEDTTNEIAVVSDENGKYRFSGVQPGAYDILVDGVDSKQKFVFDGISDIYVADIRVGMIESICLDIKCSCNRDVGVVAYNSSSEMFAAIKLSNGRFMLYDLDEGEYTIRVYNPDVCRIVNVMYDGVLQVCKVALYEPEKLTLRLAGMETDKNYIAFVLEEGESVAKLEFDGTGRAEFPKPSSDMLSIAIVDSSLSIYTLQLEFDESGEMLVDLSSLDDETSPQQNKVSNAKLTGSHRLLGYNPIDALEQWMDGVPSTGEMKNLLQRLDMALRIDVPLPDHACECNMNIYRDVCNAKSTLSGYALDLYNAEYEYEQACLNWAAVVSGDVAPALASGIITLYGIIKGNPKAAGVTVVAYNVLIDAAKEYATGKIGLPEFTAIVFKDVGPEFMSELSGQVMEVIDKLNLGQTIADARRRLNKSKEELNFAFLMANGAYSYFTRKLPPTYKDCDEYCGCGCMGPVPDPPYEPPSTNGTDKVTGEDPNEMSGPLGLGNPETERFVKPGEELTYTIYFENVSNATAAAQEVYVTNPLNEWLDWSTFRMGEVSFGNQIDIGLVDKTNGVSEATMKGTNFIVRTTLCGGNDGEGVIAKTGVAHWYLRIVDPTTETGWPSDILAGFLPPNDETFRGEGHLTYRIKVRDDAPPNVVITNSASIVFDYNDPIETDPAWWNTVAKMQSVNINNGDGVVATQLVVGVSYGGVLPEKPTNEKPGYTFAGWRTGPNGAGRQVTAESLVEVGDSGIYADWVANTYEVVFHANGGEGEMPNQTNTYDVVSCLASNAFVFAGHKFVGWATNETGAVMYKDGAVVSNLIEEANGVVDLFAKWGDWDVNFVDAEIAADEGSNAVVRVHGGNNGSTSSVKLYLAYNTAAAADLDLTKGTIDGATPKGGLKFPLTLSWAAGEIGERVITIPIKVDKTVEDDEFFTLQLAEPVGMELGDERVCTVTIRDMNDKTLKTTVTPYKPKKGETVATNSVTVASGNAKGGFVSGTGEYTSGSKLTLTAEARPGWAFVGWRRANSEDVVSDKAKWQVVVTNDSEYVAVFEKIPYVRGLADPADGGKVTGSGLCAAGKKVTLKATANKGFVFTGWVRGGRGATALPGFDERLQKGAVEYIATTPSLVVDRSAKPAKDTATSTTITNVTDDATYYACFITSDEDKASIDAAADGWALEPWVSKTETHALRTNIWAGVYLEWPVTASALSETKVKVAGLPAGLKFTDKPVTTKIGTGKNAITVTNVLANTIYGAPTAASKIDTKTKAVKPSEVKLTVTTAGKSSQTYQIDTVVDALPSWAQGTFAGGWEPEDAATSGGTVSLTVDAKGKVSGKALGDGLTYTLAAPYYSGFALDENQTSNFLADVTASWSYKEGTKTIKTNDVVQLVVQDNAIGGYAGVEDWFDAYTANWKVEPWKALGKKFDKATMAYVILADGTLSDDENYATVALSEEVTGRVSLKFAASGAVTVAGEFVSGAYNDTTKKYPTVKATGSATLVPVGEEHGEVFVYLTPKGLPPHTRCVTVPWPEE